jgi:catechol 2,3-dioxygenase-like lactoylglutathione lyase family enzyme
MKPKISYITLGVSDMARALRFYRDGLGFQPHNHHPDDEFVFLKLEGAWMALATLEALAGDVGTATLAAGEGRGFALAHNVASPAEVERVFAAALACGAKAVRMPWETDWGGVSSFFADPDGCLWEVSYNPHTDLT